MNTAATLQVTTPSDCEIVITRFFDAPRELVWDAHTRPELLRRWLLGPDGWTMPVCDIDLRVGGRFRFEWRKDDGREMGVSGVYRDVIHPSRLVHTELFDQDWTGGETLATADFMSGKGGTLLRTTVRYSSKQARDGALSTGMTSGMEAGYRRLDEMFESVT